uniref:Protein kinase domain-containing protein n=1 Tax=Coccolithus braarudii TaxID=221442 RepID=A0A7S0PYT9_9EUKA
MLLLSAPSTALQCGLFPASTTRPAPRMGVSLPSLPSPFDLFSRIDTKETIAVIDELSKIASRQDPKVVIQRSLDLSLALNTVGGELFGRTDLGAEVLPLVLRRLCEELGATYVKLGQFVASSPTLFPPEYVSEFQKCLDSTPPMAWADVRTIIESELGRPLSQVYSYVEQAPLASASIAQVHAATLLSGEDVVIKVQKKGVAGSLQADLDLLYSVSRVLQVLGVTTAELSDIVGILREAILEETDFRLEAKRTTQFRQFLQNSADLSGLVTAPKVYPDASASRILTLERLYGVSLTDLDAVRTVTDTPEAALIVALNTWVVSVLTNEWFHADVHAGNLLVLNDGRVAFIDFGIVGSIPETTAAAMIEFVRAFPMGDMNGVASALAKMGFTGQDVDVDAFARDIKEVLSSVEAVDATQVAAGLVDETQLNRLVAAVAKIATSYGIRFPREFALLVKQVLYFDRYTRLLAPDLDVLSDERLSINQPVAASSMRDVTPLVEAEVLPPSE